MAKERLRKHLVNSVLCNRIYWAASTKDDDIEMIDGDKKDVTDNAVDAVAQYMDNEAQKRKADKISIKFKGRDCDAVLTYTRIAKTTNDVLE
jgi:hypothetical protein